MVTSITNRVKEVGAQLRIGRTLGLLWSFSKQMTFLLIFMLIVETVALYASLYSIKILVDLVTNASGPLISNADRIVTQLIIAASLTVAYHIIKAISAYVTERQAATAAELINDKIHEKTISIELSFYERPAYFDILQRARNAGSDRPSALIIAVLDTVKQVFSLLAIGSIIVHIDWVLLPLLVLFVIPTLIMRIYFSDKLNAFRLKTTPLERQSMYYGQLITSEVTAKEVRTYDLGKYFKRKYLQIRMQLLAERFKISLSRTKGEIITTTLASLGLFACLGYTINHALAGKVTIGDIAIFLLLFPQIFNFLQGIATGISTIYHHNIFINSIYELLDLESSEHEMSSSQQPLNGDSAVLTFTRVCFKYPHMEKFAIRDINIQISTGKIIALVGMNGAGKSTLIKLMTRMYEPSAGHITLNGQDARHFSLRDYRKNFGVVFQDFCKYNVTAAENIGFGDIDRGTTDDMHEIERAAAQSGADTFISTFPNGYETMMGRIFDEGQEVSIGQWQKLAIARALYSQGRFLIFDEPTSALDASSEQGFFSMLSEHHRDKGILVISHRYSTIKYADYVYVMKDGEITQEGTFVELCHQQGDFANLFKEEIFNEIQL